MNTIRELKAKEKYDNMLKRKNKEIKKLRENINKAVKLLNKYRNRKDAYCLWCMDYGDNAEVIEILGGVVKNDN